MSRLKRLSSAMSPAAMLVAILALILASAGIGYTAATIGTGDLKRNAVTSPKIKNGNVKSPDLGGNAVNSGKVKNGTLKAGDLIKEKRFATASLRNGGEGDCVWTDVGVATGLGLTPVVHRMDRFGTVHLSGIMTHADGGGGDGVCGGGDSSESVEDLTAFVLPSASRPATHIARSTGSGIVFIGGPGGLDAGGGQVIPAGAVVYSGLTGDTIILDSISFLGRGTNLFPRPATREITPAGRRLIKEQLGLG